jgi:predicted negative regulator of RcsB-dependent stress response
MREDLEQQEQLDAIKGFWNENRRWIVPFVSLLLIAAVSFNGWNWYANRQASQASVALFALEGALAEQRIENAQVAYQALVSGYAGSAQRALGGLQLAKAHVSQGALDQAATVLRGVADKSPEEFAWIARIRLSGVLMDDNDLRGALAVISGTPPKDYLPLVLDRRGDGHLLLGEKDQAKAAWQAALEGLPAQSPTRELVLRKLQTMNSFGG